MSSYNKSFKEIKDDLPRLTIKLDLLREVTKHYVNIHISRAPAPVSEGEILMTVSDAWPYYLTPMSPPVPGRHYPRIMDLITYKIKDQVDKDDVILGIKWFDSIVDDMGVEIHKSKRLRRRVEIAANGGLLPYFWAKILGMFRRT